VGSWTRVRMPRNILADCFSQMTVPLGRRSSPGSTAIAVLAKNDNRSSDVNLKHLVRGRTNGATPYAIASYRDVVYSRKEAWLRKLAHLLRNPRGRVANVSRPAKGADSAATCGTGATANGCAHGNRIPHRSFEFGPQNAGAFYAPSTLECHQRSN
jgi:hypothetical protein